MSVCCFSSELLVCCQKRTFPLIFWVFLIVKIIKCQFLGNGKNISQPVWKYRKIHCPTFPLLNIFSKIKAPGKGEEGKDFCKEPVHLFFTPRCREPSSDGRAVSVGCTAASTYYTPYGRFLLLRWNSVGVQPVKLTCCYLAGTKLVQKAGLLQLQIQMCFVPLNMTNTVNVCKVTFLELIKWNKCIGIIRCQDNRRDVKVLSDKYYKCTCCVSIWYTLKLNTVYSVSSLACTMCSPFWTDLLGGLD